MGTKLSVPDFGRTGAKAARQEVREIVSDLAKEINLELSKRSSMTTNYEKYPHYFKPIPKTATHLDVYAVLQLFGVTDQAIGHAIKKLLVPGVRGTKSKAQDIKEAIDTLTRWQTMQTELVEPPDSSETDVSSLVPETNFIARLFNGHTTDTLGSKPQCTCNTGQQVSKCNIRRTNSFDE